MFFKNKSKSIQIKFGVPYFDLFDPRFPDFSVPVSVRGSVSFQIKNFKKFLKQQGYKEMDEDDFKKKIQNSIIRYVKESLINIPMQYNLSVFQIERKIAEVAELASDDLTKRMKREFRIVCSSVDITTIELDKTSDGYRQLKAVTQDVTTATVHAELEAKLQQIREEKRIELENLEKSISSEKNKKKNLIPLLTTACIIGAIIIIGLIVLLLL